MFVAEGAVVRDSILFPDTIVGPGSVVDRAILDKNVVVGSNVHLGVDPPGFGEGPLPPNRTEPRNLTTGITIVGKGARLPSGLRVGRNCRIGSDVFERDFEPHRSDGSGGTAAFELPSGETLDAPAPGVVAAAERRASTPVE